MFLGMVYFSGFLVVSNIWFFVPPILGEMKQFGEHFCVIGLKPPSRQVPFLPHEIFQEPLT